MSLLSSLRERREERVATAIPAIPATQPGQNAGTVARIATVAVANATEEETAKPGKVSGGDTATASHWWLMHFVGLDPVECYFVDPVTYAEVLERYPNAVAAEPLAPTISEHKPGSVAVHQLAPVPSEIQALIDRVMRALDCPESDRHAFTQDWRDDPTGADSALRHLAAYYGGDHGK